MNDYDNFHDGVFDGVWVDGNTAYLFLSTFRKEHFTAVADGVVALTVTNFKKGNLIFEVVTCSHEELTSDDIAALYDVREGAEGVEQATKLLTKAQQEKLSVLEINPSYGATCLVLAHSVEMVAQNEWSAKYLASAMQRPM